MHKIMRKIFTINIFSGSNIGKVMMSVLAVISFSACSGGGGSSFSVDSSGAGAGFTGVPGAPAASCISVFNAAPSGRANQGVIEFGEFVGTDEIHFARGANADGVDHEEYYAPGGTVPPPAPSPQEQDDAYRHSTWGAFGLDRAPHNGDYLLPTDTSQWPDFTADIGFMRMQADATDLFIRIRFLSFPRPEAQITTMAFSTAGSALAVNAWPRNAGIGSAHSHALTLWGTGGEVAIAGGAVSTVAALGGEVCISDHAIEARVPLAALPAGPWDVSVGAGLADPADPTMYWTVPVGQPTATSPGTDSANAPGSNVWDLMFTPHDPLFHDDHVQAELLTSGDVSAATIQIDPSILQAGGSVPAPPILGRIAHTYESRFHFGDGIERGSPPPPGPPTCAPFSLGTPLCAPDAGVRQRDPAVNYEYTGGLQPYFAYVPSTYPGGRAGDWPLVLYFHGLNNYIWEPFGLTLGLERELENRQYLFASLLGRGDLFFEGRGELDPLEVIEHMAARYQVDRDRIYLVGHSHGAGGVQHVASRNPDLFAGAVSAQIMDGPLNLENMMHVPYMQIAGTGDPIDNGNGAMSRYNALSALGYDATWYQYNVKTHENSSISDAITQIFDMYDRHVRPENPATVVYTRSGGDFDEALGLLHDGAYWVSDMVAANPAQDMTVRAESFGIAHAPLDPPSATVVSNQAVDTNASNGRPPNDVSGRSQAFLSQTTPAFGPAAPVENRATLQLTNVAEITLDVTRMSIDLFAPGAQLDIDTDGDGTLRLLLPLSPPSAVVSLFDSAGALISSARFTSAQGGILVPLTPAVARVELDR